MKAQNLATLYGAKAKADVKARRRLLKQYVERNQAIARGLRGLKIPYDATLHVYGDGWYTIRIPRKVDARKVAFAMLERINSTSARFEVKPGDYRDGRRLESWAPAGNLHLFEDAGLGFPEIIIGDSYKECRLVTEWREHQVWRCD